MFENMFQLGEQPYSEDDAEWDDFVEAHPNGSFLQTTQWARLKSRFNWKAYRVWVKEEGKLVAGAQILFRSAAFRMVKMAYIPHGPVVDWGNDRLVKVLFNQIDWAVYQHRAGLLKVEPFIWQRDMAQDDWLELCDRLELVTETDTVQPPRTMLIDISGSEDEVMASFRSKTRYNIRLSGRKEVTVREATPDDIPTFNALMKITGTRNAFGVHASEYYQACYELFKERDNAAILLAEYDGKPLAGVLLIKCGEQCVYLAGGSSNEERNRMPSYAVQWAAIKWAKQHGCTYYDMWGLPDEDAETLEAEFKERNDGLWGVYRFKRGFNGEVARTVGCADKVYNKLVYKLYQRRRGSR